MPVNILQVKECECVKCGYRWINRKNGADGPIPCRCIKCKHLEWEFRNMSRTESRYRYELRETFRKADMSCSTCSWMSDPNVDKLLKYRPSIEEMKVILEPICYLKDRNHKIIRTIFDDERNKSPLKRVWSKEWDLRDLKRLRRALGKKAIKNSGKARAYQVQLSRQLIEYFLEKYSTATGAHLL